MAYQVVQAESGIERQIITAMIMSKEVLAEVSDKWHSDDGLFDCKWWNIVGSWCVKYYRKYNSAPGKEIQGIYAYWMGKTKRDPKVAEMISDLLESLSKEFASKKGKEKSKINAPFVIDLAGEHFNKVAAVRMADEIKGLAAIGKVNEIQSTIAKFGSGIEMGRSAGIDVFTSKKQIAKVLAHQRKSMFTWPGALGEFFGNEMEREGFISIMAPEKRGKTWVLLDIAWQAMLAKCRVACFQVGDLSEHQVLRRLYTRAAGRPLTTTRKGHPVKYPIKLMRHEGDEMPTVVHKRRSYRHKMTDREVWDACCRVQLMDVKSSQSYFKLSVHPNSSINIAGIRNIIDGWARSGWLADVIIIDYADILSPPAGQISGSREAINETWQQMRRLSQEYRCLVVTATQANAESYTADVLTMKHFSEDKRKFSHVTGMLGLNQSPDEKMMGLLRYNWLVLREDEFISTKQVWVAQCLAAANPAVLSCS